MSGKRRKYRNLYLASPHVGGLKMTGGVCIKMWSKKDTFHVTTSSLVSFWTDSVTGTCTRYMFFLCLYSIGTHKKKSSRCLWWYHFVLTVACVVSGLASALQFISSAKRSENPNPSTRHTVISPNTISWEGLISFTSSFSSCCHHWDYIA